VSHLSIVEFSVFFLCTTSWN